MLGGKLHQAGRFLFSRTFSDLQSVHTEIIYPTNRRIMNFSICRCWQSSKFLRLPFPASSHLLPRNAHATSVAQYILAFRTLCSKVPHLRQRAQDAAEAGLRLRWGTARFLSRLLRYVTSRVPQLKYEPALQISCFFCTSDFVSRAGGRTCLRTART